MGELTNGSQVRGYLEEFGFKKEELDGVAAQAFIKYADENNVTISIRRYPTSSYEILKEAAWKEDSGIEIGGCTNGNLDFESFASSEAITIAYLTCPSEDMGFLFMTAEANEFPG